MPPDGFDDVEFRILEGPEPPQGPPRRRGRWVVAIAASVLAAGALAAGASALTGGDDPAPAAQPPAAERQFEHHRFGHRGGHDCHRGEQPANPDSSTLKY
jgi:hypothetical protein